MSSPPPKPHDDSTAGSDASRASGEDGEPIRVVSVPAIVPTPPPADDADADADAHPRSRGRRPARLVAHDSQASFRSGGSGCASTTSDCIVRCNSIRFKHESSSYSEDDGSAGTGSFKLNEMEVMDLRSSFASSGSNASYPGVDANTLFEVASKAGRGGIVFEGGGPSVEAAALFRVASKAATGESSLKIVTPSARDDPPQHWVRTAEGVAGVSRSLATSGGANPRVSPHGTSSAEASFVLPPYDFQEPGEERSEGGSEMSELSPLSREKRLRRNRRKLYVRRCARAMALFVALAALSASAIYFLADDPDSVLDALVAGLFGDEDGPDADHRLLPQDRLGGEELETYVNELSRREADLTDLLRARHPAEYDGSDRRQRAAADGGADRRPSPRAPDNPPGPGQPQEATDRNPRVDAPAEGVRGAARRRAATFPKRAHHRRGGRAAFRHAAGQHYNGMQYYSHNVQLSLGGPRGDAGREDARGGPRSSVR